MNTIWLVKNWKTLILLYQIGFRNGLKSGESPTDKEYYEVYKRHPDWLEPLGQTNIDLDMLTGELRERGLKVLNTRELERRKN